VKGVYTVLPHAASGPEQMDAQEVLTATIEYTWSTKAGAPGSIKSAHRKVEFIYEDIPTSAVPGLAGVEFAYENGIKWMRTKRLKSITMSAPMPDGTMATPVQTAWSYHLKYEMSTHSGRSLLTSVQQCSSTDNSLPNGNCFWKKVFTWYGGSKNPSFVSQNLGDFAMLSPNPESAGTLGPMMMVMDVNDDGLDDAIIQRGATDSATMVLKGEQDVTGQVMPLKQVIAQALPSKVSLNYSTPVDFDGNGASELWVLTQTDPGTPDINFDMTCHQRLLRWDEAAKKFAYLVGQPNIPDYYCGPLRGALQTRFLDLDGDGREDMLAALDQPDLMNPNVDPPRVVYGKWEVYRNTGNKFEPVYKSNVQAGCPTHVVDTDGDGREELITGKVTLTPGKTPDQCLALANVQRVQKMEGANINALQVEESSFASSMWPKAGPEGKVYWGDFNGDGLIDTLQAARVPGQDVASTVSLRWNTGNGFTPSQPVTLTLHNDVRFWDANQDGRMDILTIPAADQNNPWASVSAKLYFSKGDGSFSAGTIAGGLESGMWVDNDFNASLKVNEIATYPASALGDFNGDGFSDWLVVRQTVQSTNPLNLKHSLQLYTQRENYADRLQTVQDEGRNWPSVEVKYSTTWADRAVLPLPTQDCHYPYACQDNRGSVVVRELLYREHWTDLTNLAQRQPRTLYYSYGRFRTDAKFGPLGFEWVRAWDPLLSTEVTTQYNHRPMIKLDKPDLRFYQPLPKEKTTITLLQPLSSVSYDPNVGPLPQVNARVTRQSILEWELRVTGQRWLMLPRTSSVRTWEQKVDFDLGLTRYTENNPPLSRLFGEQGAPNVLRQVDTLLDYDAFGNVTFAETKTQNGPTITMEATYDNLTGPWLLGLMRSQTVSHKEADPAIPLHQNQVSYSYTPEGYLWMVEGEPSANEASLKLKTTLTYNPYGLVTSMSAYGMNSQGVMETRVRHVEYDALFPGQPQEMVYPSQVWSPVLLNNSYMADPRLSSWTAIHPALGVPVATRNSLGIRSWAYYDWAGRPTKVGGDGISDTTFRYAGRADKAGGINGMVVTTQQLIKNNGVMATGKMTTDGLGRTLTQSGTGFDGPGNQPQVEVQTQYDTWGRVSAVSRPYPVLGQPSAFSKYQYDNLGRVTSFTAPGSNPSQLTYQVTATGSSVEMTDPVGNKHRTERDIIGRTLKSIDYLQSGNSLTPVTTHYRYGKGGVLDQVTDPKGNVSSTVVDIRGRPTEQTDPGTGTILLTYDSFGAVRTTTHVQTGENAAYLYDVLGRTKTYTIKDTAGTTLFQSNLVWDSALNGLGQLTSASAQNGALPAAEMVSTINTYDTLGRADSVSQVVDNKAYVMRTAYDEEGRLRALMYPATGGDPAIPGFKTCYGYNPQGALVSVGSASNTAPLAACPMPGDIGYSPLWQVTKRNLDGALLQGQFGNGMIAMRDYEPATGRLKRTAAFAQGSANALFDLNYGYDLIGRVIDRNDPVTQRKEHFNYDRLSRLTEWHLTVNQWTKEQHYDYDLIGNLTEVNTRGYSSATPVASIPTIPRKTIEKNLYLHLGKPHAVSRYEEYDPANGQLLQAREFNYDAQGRQTDSTQALVDQAPVMHRVMNYSLGGLLPRTLITSEGTWTLTYNAQGERVKKVGKDGTTISLGDVYERRERDGQVKHVLQIAGTDGPVAQVTLDPKAIPSQEVSYRLHDALGSSGATVNAAGQVTERFFNEPFGKRIEADGTPYQTSLSSSLARLTDGFTSHEMEFFGAGNDLINMKGRLYDPITRRFLSPDPVVMPHSQGLNRYSYVLNSPTLLTDPDGFRPRKCIPADCSDPPCPPGVICVTAQGSPPASDIGAINDDPNNAANWQDETAGNNVGKGKEGVTPPSRLGTRPHNDRPDDGRTSQRANIPDDGSLGGNKACPTIFGGNCGVESAPTAPTEHEPPVREDEEISIMKRAGELLGDVLCTISLCAPHIPQDPYDPDSGLNKMLAFAKERGLGYAPPIGPPQPPPETLPVEEQIEPVLLGSLTGGGLRHPKVGPKINPLGPSHIPPSNPSPKIILNLGKSKKLARAADKALESHRKEIERLVDKLGRGLDPGIGNEPIGRGFSEARSAAHGGPRVYFRRGRDGVIEIVGYSTKDNQQQIIDEILRVF